MIDADNPKTFKQPDSEQRKELLVFSFAASTLGLWALVAEEKNTFGSNCGTHRWSRFIYVIPSAEEDGLEKDCTTGRSFEKGSPASAHLGADLVFWKPLGIPSSNHPSRLLWPLASALRLVLFLNTIPGRTLHFSPLGSPVVSFFILCTPPSKLKLATVFDHFGWFWR